MCVSLGVNAHGYHTPHAARRNELFSRDRIWPVPEGSFGDTTNDVMKDSSLKNQVDIINEANQAGF
jgi:hypothetical protein